MHPLQAPTGHSWNDLVRIGRAPDCPGYFGSPRLATTALGAKSAKSDNTLIEIALKILDGLDERKIPRNSEMLSKSEANVAIDRDAIERERQIEKQQQAWLQKSR